MIFSGCQRATNGTAAKKKKPLHESNNSFYSGPDQKMQKPTIVHNPRARVIVTAATTKATVCDDMKLVHTSVLGKSDIMSPPSALLWFMI